MSASARNLKVSNGDTTLFSRKYCAHQHRSITGGRGLEPRFALCVQAGFGCNIESQMRSMPVALAAAASSSADER